MRYLGFNPTEEQQRELRQRLPADRGGFVSYGGEDSKTEMCSKRRYTFHCLSFRFFDFFHNNAHNYRREKLLESSGGEDKKETMPQISYRITFRILRKQITPQAV